MPLPIGTWKMNINGRELDLTIESAQEGIFNLTLLGEAQTGFWDEVSQTISFALTKQPASTNVALFKGYLFRTPDNPAPGRDVVATLAGSVSLNPGSFAGANLITSSRRNVFGWFAQITEVV